VLRFTDNALIDVPGPDLWVFEVGPSVEPTEVAISRDWTAWIDVGKIAGGTAGLDIGQVREAGRVVLVRAPDRFEEGLRRQMLKPSAKQALHDAANSIRSVGAATVRVEGHTDNVGSDAVNQKLSLARANAVRDYLQSAEGLKGTKMETAGFAATRPVATNATPDGREKNRRVEILVVPKS